MIQQTSFTKMAEATPEDYEIIMEHSKGFVRELPDRILAHLALLKGDTGGYAVDRYTHCLQSATRAYRDGKDEEARRKAATQGNHRNPNRTKRNQPPDVIYLIECWESHRKGFPRLER